MTNASSHECKHQECPAVCIRAEVAINPGTHPKDALLVEVVAKDWLQSLSRIPTSTDNETIFIDYKENSYLSRHVVSIGLEIFQHPPNQPTAPCGFYLPWEVSWHVTAFTLNSTEPEDGESYDDDDDDCPSFRQYNLPAIQFHGLWESLHYDAATVKQRLLSYSSSALHFSKQNVNQNFVNFGRVVLLHGPPGTGKTSLCKALAHKLAIRLCDTFPAAELIEVNAHSLFSRWFSESGKLIAKLFQNIKERLEDEHTFIFVLVDEVESLAASRDGHSPSGGDPSDAMRAVNALLTKLDQLKVYKNCMILTTSNQTGSIDAAFLDRADIKMYVDVPNEQNRHRIMKDSINELIRVGIMSPHHVADEGRHDDADGVMWRIAEATAGMSGRTLRKIPFLAHATLASSMSESMAAIPYQRFLEAVLYAIQVEKKDRATLQQ